MLIRPLRFCLTYVGLSLLIGVLSIAGLVFFDIDTGSASTGVIPILMAAMLEGQAFVGRATAGPDLAPCGVRPFL